MTFSLNYSMFIQVGLLILGGWWCKEIFSRLGSDIEELKEPDGARRGVIAGLWIVTAVILVLMAGFLWSVIAKIVPMLR